MSSYHPSFEFNRETSHADECDRRDDRAKQMSVHSNPKTELTSEAITHDRVR
jgi:hypothetical protein